jgi:anthraniloyl-CoA monooxygenase
MGSSISALLPGLDRDFSDGDMMRVSCVGAGPASLYLAILLKLRDPGAEITIFEQNPAGVTHGWGVVFFDGMVDSLWQHDPITARAILDQSFEWTDQVLDMDSVPLQRGVGRGYSIHRQKLLDVLARRASDIGVQILFETRIDHPDRLPESDLIVAADGAGSRLRHRNAQRFKTRISEGRNKYVWLGTTKVFDNFTFGLASTAAGWIWFHAYGFSREMSTLIVECSPETWAGLGFDRLDRDESLRRLEQIFRQQLAGQSLLSKASGDQALPWLNFRWVENRTWFADNLVLMGDAAHTTHFSIGSGTQLAIQDAMSLARNLQTHVDLHAALSSYDTERRSALKRPLAEARLSAKWFENIADYTHLEASELLRILLSRRSVLLHHLPLGVYCRLDRITRQVPILQRARRVAAAAYKG